MLTHYTKTVGAIGNILRHGFAWIPNRRKLAHVLIPQHDYSRREPQQFGMISFTELEREEAEGHRGAFGSFGITVTDHWARTNGAQRVVYVDEVGAVVEALRSLFSIGYSDVQSKIAFPEDGAWLMAYENKAVASSVAGSAMWANLLQLWEFLEPSSSASQREWRIVNSKPYYGLSEDRTKVIAQVSPPHNWAKFTNVVKVSRNDVRELVCPESVASELRRELPSNYGDITISQFAG